MDRYSDVIQNESGRAVAGATVLILDESGQVATIYADRTGTPAANPITVDALGRWSFCAADGVYSARAYLGGVLKGELKDIRLEDVSDGLAVLSAPGGAALIGSIPAGAVTATTVQGAINDLGSAVKELQGVEQYVLPTASDTVKGGIRIGAGLSVDGDGVVSASGVAEGTVATVNAVAPVDGNVSLTTGDMPEGSNLYHTVARVRATTLAGLSTATNAAIAAADTVLGALGKLQKQISDQLAAKDATGGYAGLTLFKINFKNAANTFTSFLANANTAARTYTFPDKDGTVAMTSDVGGGAVVLLGSATVGTPVANIDFLSLFSAAYDKYTIEIQHAFPSADNTLAFRVAVAGAIVTTGYDAMAASGGAMVTSQSAHLLTPAPSKADGLIGATLTLELRNANDTTTAAPKSVGARGFNHATSNEFEVVVREGSYRSTTALSGFRLFWLSGANFVGGKVRVYGHKNT